MVGAGFQIVGLRTVAEERSVPPLLRRLMDGDDDVGTVRALDSRRTENQGESKKTQRIPSRHFICPGEDQVMAQDRTSARGSRSQRCRLRKPAPAQLFVAGICSECHGFESGPRLYWNLQRLPRAQARSGGDWHQCP